MICTLFKVKRSQIHGKGCFAGVDLVPGIMFPIPTTQVPEKNCTEKTFYWEDEYYEPYKPFCYLNHSDYPNAEVFWFEDDNTLYLYTNKLILQDHEITINYDQEP
jgi:hypothetical protein